MTARDDLRRVMNLLGDMWTPASVTDERTDRLYKAIAAEAVKAAGATPRGTWEAVYASAMYTPRWLADTQDKKTAQIAAVGWYQSQRDDCGPLSWTLDGALITEQYDQVWTLAEHDSDGGPLATDVVVRRRDPLFRPGPHCARCGTTEGMLTGPTHWALCGECITELSAAPTAEAGETR